VLRKFKAQVLPTAALRALATLVSECDESGWPDQWGALREGAREVLLAVRQETDGLLSLLSRIDAGRGVLTLFADERDRALTAAGVITVSIDFDLSTLLSDDEHGPDALRAFVTALERVAHSSHYALALRMGTRDASLDEVLAELTRQAHDRGVLLRTSDGASRSSSPEERASSERIDPREVFGEGLYEPVTSLEALDDLDEEERSFLDEAGIGWPARRRELEEAWRQVAFAAHPDRRPDDPRAQHRFVRLKAGFERLRERTA
jgi:hypothetical protein